MRAFFRHVERLFERKCRRKKQVSFLTTRAFHSQHIAYNRSFSFCTHVILFSLSIQHLAESRELRAASFEFDFPNEKKSSFSKSIFEISPNEKSNFLTKNKLVACGL